MYYIYVYTNLINNKKYIGQTNNPQRRFREHKSTAFNKESCSYNSAFHRALRKYGYDAFSVEIIDKAETQEEINQLEKYYIDKFDTLAWKGKGYNLEPGGTERKDAYSLQYSPETIQAIKQDLKTGLSYQEITNRYGITKGYISEINHGHRFQDDNENYPLSKRQEDKESEKVKKAIDLLQHSNFTLEQIAKEVGYNNKGSITRINNGSYHFNPKLKYPLRKTKLQKNIEAAELLRDTDMSFYDIADEVGLGVSTIRNINKGTYRKFEGFNYPIR